MSRQPSSGRACSSTRKKVYHKIHDSTTIVREAIICQRENPFYIDTVRDFRDRRYDYKGKAKVWKGKTDALKSVRRLGIRESTRPRR